MEGDNKHGCTVWQWQYCILWTANGHQGRIQKLYHTLYEDEEILISQEKPQPISALRPNATPRRPSVAVRAQLQPRDVGSEVGDRLQQHDCSLHQSSPYVILIDILSRVRFQSTLLTLPLRPVDKQRRKNFRGTKYSFKKIVQGCPRSEKGYPCREGSAGTVCWKDTVHTLYSVLICIQADQWACRLRNTTSPVQSEFCHWFQGDLAHKGVFGQNVPKF